MPDDARCKTCRYLGRGGTEQIVCRRFPPAYHATAPNQFPMVTPMAWCGEWSAPDVQPLPPEPHTFISSEDFDRIGRRDAFEPKSGDAVLIPATVQPDGTLRTKANLEDRTNALTPRRWNGKA